jgi:hypothetical protein
LDEQQVQDSTEASHDASRRVRRAVSDLGVDGRIRPSVLEDATAQVVACASALRAVREVFPEFGPIAIPTSHIERSPE